MQAEELHVLHVLSHFDNGVHVFHADAELVLCQTGSNVGMSVCTDIRIDAESHLSHLTLGCSQFVDDFQFGYGFYIEAEDVVVKAIVDFLIGLAYTGKHNLVAWETGFYGCTYFASAYTIGTKSAFANYF